MELFPSARWLRLMKVSVCWEKLGGNCWSASIPASTPLVWALTTFLRWIFSRHGRSQGLLFKHLCQLLIHSFTDPLVKISLRRRHALLVEDGVFGHKIDYVAFFLGDSKSWRASKLHYWFKSYDDFAEWLNFACWWSCIGKGLRLQLAQPACL